MVGPLAGDRGADFLQRPVDSDWEGAPLTAIGDTCPLRRITL